jgi:hypothetical protein
LKQIRQSSEALINDDGTNIKKAAVIKDANFVLVATPFPAARSSFCLQSHTSAHISTGNRDP